MAKRRKRRQKSYAQRPDPFWVGTFIFLSVVGTGLMASVMPVVALIQGSFLLISGLLFFDHNRRQFWEMAADSKMRTLEESQHMLEIDVKHHSERLNDLKLGIAEKDIIRTESEEIIELTEAVILDSHENVGIDTAFITESASAGEAIAAEVIALQNIEGRIEDKEAAVASVTDSPAPPVRFQDLVEQNQKTQKSQKQNKKQPTVKPQKQKPVTTATSTTVTSQTFKDDPQPRQVRKEIFSAPAEKQDFAAIANDDSIFSPGVVQQLLHQTIESQNIEMFVQPIVNLPQRQTRFYELFARLKANETSYVPASQFMKKAREDHLNHDIDNLLLVECLRVIRASAYIENATPFFVNVTSSTLKNSAFMNRLLSFIKNNKKLASRLVFEIPQTDYDDLSLPVLEIVRGLGRIGCSFSLGNVGNLDIDVEDLLKHKVRYLKIENHKLQQAIGTHQGLRQLMKTKRRLEGNGVALIAEKIENEGDLRNLMDLDLNFAQGYLFGKPNVQAAYTSAAKAA